MLDLMVDGEGTAGQDGRQSAKEEQKIKSWGGS